MFSEVAIATITLARSATEEGRILKSLGLLVNTGIKIIAVDGGSPEQFTNQLSHLKGIQLIQSEKKGLFSQVERSLQEAAQKQPYVFYTEPDKYGFFSGNLMNDFFEQANSSIALDSTIGIVIPSRSPESFATFPPAQQYYESIANKKMAEALNQPEADYIYGPMLMDSRLVPLLDTCPSDIGWGWMSYLRLAAYRQGRKTKCIEMELPCLSEDKQETEQDQDYRCQQCSQHLRAIDLVEKTL